MRSILLALLVICFGAATAKQALDDKTIRVAVRAWFHRASAFDQDISGWAVHSVTRMDGMFAYASAFDQDISGWAVHSVTRMPGMFAYASAFNQDLGWCVADEVDLDRAFEKTKCASTSCGVVQVADVADCPAPARKYPRCDDGLRAF